MSSRPSAVQTRAPCPLAMKTGWPPTALNARTGELTPPGITRSARSKSLRDGSIGTASGYLTSIRSGLRAWRERARPELSARPGAAQGRRREQRNEDEEHGEQAGENREDERGEHHAERRLREARGFLVAP